MKISFYRSASNHRDELYKSPIFSVTVPDAVPREQAVVTAIQQFQDTMKVRHWQELAELYEVE